MTAREIWIGALLDTTGLGEGGAVHLSTLTPTETSSTHRRDHCGVNRELSTIEERKPVSDDFQSSTIVTCDWQVQVPNEQVGGDAGTCLATDPGSSDFNRETPTAQDTCPRARCVVVAKDVEWTATPAGTRRQGQRKPEVAKKKDTEKLRRETREGRQGHSQEHGRARLRTHESLLRRCKSRPQHFSAEVSLESLSSEELPAMGGHAWVHLVKIDLAWAQTTQQRQPIRTIEADLCQLETTRHCSLDVNGSGWRAFKGVQHGPGDVSMALADGVLATCVLSDARCASPVPPCGMGDCPNPA